MTKDELKKRVAELEDIIADRNQEIEELVTANGELNEMANTLEDRLREAVINGKEPDYDQLIPEETVKLIWTYPMPEGIEPTAWGYPLHVDEETGLIFAHVPESRIEVELNRGAMCFVTEVEAVELTPVDEDDKFEE